MSAAGPGDGLQRRMGLLGATSTNIIGMVGIGPFLTIPLMVYAMGGPHIIWAWLVGALLSLAGRPRLRPARGGAAGERRAVHLSPGGVPAVRTRAADGVSCSCSTSCWWRPLSLAGGAVGFADYLGFYLPELTGLPHHLAAAGVCLLVLFLLYRNIDSVERLSKAMLALVLATTGWVIVAGLVESPGLPSFMPPYGFDAGFWPALGAASVIAMYSFGGYNQVCNIAGEVKDPERNVPRSILLSIVVVAAIYIAMTTVMLELIPWQEAEASRTLASIFIARTVEDPGLAQLAGSVITALILFVAVASVFAFALGYSRMPYAAARDGQFFAIFGKVHPTRGFPHVSLVWLIAVSIPFCFFSLGELINWLMQVQILLRFAWQCVAGAADRPLPARHPPALPDVALPDSGAPLARALDRALLHRATHRGVVLAGVPRPRPHRLLGFPKESGAGGRHPTEPVDAGWRSGSGTLPPHELVVR